MPKLVEGYNMLIWEHEDGTASFTGSFNAREWGDYLGKSGSQVAEVAQVPDPEETSSDTNADLNAPSVEEPAGNASKNEWREFALAQGASEGDVADLSRNQLREQYGTQEES